MGAPYITGKGFGILAASWKLAISADNQGDALAIDLSDDDSRTTWLVVVKAQTAEGEYVVGAVRTRAPASGDPKSRTIALAWHPGAKSWAVDFYGPRGATARPVLATGKCPGGGFFGVVPANGSRLERRIWQLPFFVAAVQGALSPGPSSLMKAYGWSDPAIGAGLFVGFVDKAAPVVNGDAWAALPIPVFPGALFAFNYQADGADDGGLVFVNQIRFAVSATPGIVTLAGTGVAMQAERI